MKRLVILILAGILCLGSFGYAFAEDANRMELSIGYVEGNTGDTVIVPIYGQMSITTGTFSMDSLEFVLTYDAEALTLNGTVLSDGALDSDILDTSVIVVDNAANAGEYRFTAISAYGVQTSGVLVKLEFVKKTDARCELSIENCKYSFIDLANIGDEAVQSRYQSETIVSIEDPSAADTIVLDGSAIQRTVTTNPVDIDDVVGSSTDVDPSDIPAVDDSMESAGTPWYLWVIYIVLAVAIIAGIVFAVIKSKKKEQVTEE